MFNFGHWRYSGRKVVLWNFAKFTGKQLCQSLFFNRVADLTLFKKKLWHRCFPVNFAKFLQFFLQNTSGRLLQENYRNISKGMTERFWYTTAYSKIIIYTEKIWHIVVVLLLLTLNMLSFSVFTHKTNICLKSTTTANNLQISNHFWVRNFCGNRLISEIYG